MPTRVIVVAANALARDAWRILLGGQPGLAVSRMVAHLAEVALPAEGDDPLAVLVDLPELSLDEVRQLRAAMPSAGILALTAAYDLSQLLPLLQAGASGAVSRDESVAGLVRALVAAGRGELALPPAVASHALLALARGEAAPAPIDSLSEREVEVLRLLAAGLTNKDIAQTLFLSVRTVEAHLRSVYAKLGVRSRTEAALWAVRHG